MAEKNDNYLKKEDIPGVTVEGDFLMYRGKPLVREANTICYGFMDDQYYLLLTIMSTRMEGDKEVPDKILVQLVNTDQSLPATQRIAKQDMKTGLFDAFEIGIIWYDRYNA